MEGLEFTPSESVWANIQKAVAGRRDRRGGFFFWRLALPATLLAGLMSVAYFAAKTGRTSPATQSTQPAAASLKAAATPTAPAAGTTTQGTTTTAPTIGSAAQPPAATPQPSATTPQPSATRPAAARQSTFDHETLQDRAVADHNTHNSIGRPVTGNRTAGNRTTAGEPRDAIESREAVQSGAAPSREAVQSGAVLSRDAAPARRATGTKAPAISPYRYQPALAGQRNAAAIKAATPSTKRAIISIGRLQKADRPWEAGFTAGGGVSRLNRLNISAATQDQTLSANLYNIATTNAAPSKSYVSDIRPDASFMAGIYLQKPLSSRWSVNLGMNLHYFSTRITIGQQVNTYVPAAASLIVPTVTAAAQTSTAFIAGNRQVFTNHYYFLELPVNVQYQLNKSHLLPVFLESGVSLSRLMGSDALFYNAHSGVYYKDPGVLQKTQFNVSSALMVGLPFHGIRIMAGPQAQYGLTPLIDNHNQGDQHFLYAGLRVVVIPGRK